MQISNRGHNLSTKRVGLILLFIIIFLIWTLITIFGQWSDIKEIKNELINLQNEEKKVLDIKSGLEKEEIMLHDYEYIAEIARKYYFLSKPGEIIIISPKN